MTETAPLENTEFIKIEPMYYDELEHGNSAPDMDGVGAEATLSQYPAGLSETYNCVVGEDEGENKAKNQPALQRYSDDSSKQDIGQNIGCREFDKFTGQVLLDSKPGCRSDAEEQSPSPHIEESSKAKRCKKKKKSKKHKNKNNSSIQANRVTNTSINDEACADKQAQTKMIECCLCKKQFLSCKSLEKHGLEHNSDFHVRCLICGKTFADPDRLRSHAALHLQEKQFVCQSCGKTFRRSTNLLRHEPACGKDKPMEELCTLCGKLCHSKWQLQQHMMFHSDDRPFPCDYCSKSFRFKTRLAEHQRTHLGIKPHVCNICKKTFTTSSDMKKHRQRHQDPAFKGYNTENNPNKLSECRICNERVVNLKNHMSIHFDKGRGTCNVCGKILKTKSLYQHLKTHLEGAAYQCDVCSRTFNRKDNMLSHRERHFKVGFKSNVANDDVPSDVFG